MGGRREAPPGRGCSACSQMRTGGHPCHGVPCPPLPSTWAYLGTRGVTRLGASRDDTVGRHLPAPSLEVGRARAGEVDRSVADATRAAASQGLPGRGPARGMLGIDAEIGRRPPLLAPLAPRTGLRGVWDTASDRAAAALPQSPVTAADVVPLSGTRPAAGAEDGGRAWQRPVRKRRQPCAAPATARPSHPSPAKAREGLQGGRALSTRHGPPFPLLRSLTWAPPARGVEYSPRPAVPPPCPPSAAVGLGQVSGAFRAGAHKRP